LYLERENKTPKKKKQSMHNKINMNEDKRGKTCNQSPRARENMRLLPNAGKYATSRAQRSPTREITA